MQSARLIRFKVASTWGQSEHNACKCLRAEQKMLRTNNSADVLGKMIVTKPLYRRLEQAVETAARSPRIWTAARRSPIMCGDLAGNGAMAPIQLRGWGRPLCHW
jgi:hypothetical protein